MRLLLDANLSPQVAQLLAAEELDVRHVAEVGLLSASDGAIFDYAAEHATVVVTADADFPMLLALRRSSSPSVILLRGVSELQPAEVAALVVDNLASVDEELERGAVVSLSPTALRWRRLPIE